MDLESIPAARPKANRPAQDVLLELVQELKSCKKEISQLVRENAKLVSEVTNMVSAMAGMARELVELKRANVGGGKAEGPSYVNVNLRRQQ